MGNNKSWAPVVAFAEALVEIEKKPIEQIILDVRNSLSLNDGAHIAIMDLEQRQLNRLRSLAIEAFGPQFVMSKDDYLLIRSPANCDRLVDALCNLQAIAKYTEQPRAKSLSEFIQEKREQSAAGTKKLRGISTGPFVRLRSLIDEKGRKKFFEHYTPDTDAIRREITAKLNLALVAAKAQSIENLVIAADNLGIILKPEQEYIAKGLTHARESVRSDFAPTKPALEWLNELFPLLTEDAIRAEAKNKPPPAASESRCP